MLGFISEPKLRLSSKLENNNFHENVKPFGKRYKRDIEI